MKGSVFQRGAKFPDIVMTCTRMYHCDRRRVEQLCPCITNFAFTSDHNLYKHRTLETARTRTHTQHTRTHAMHARAKNYAAAHILVLSHDPPTPRSRAKTFACAYSETHIYTHTQLTSRGALNDWTNAKEVLNLLASL